MAGSINLSLSQQFDKLNGNLLSGGRLYFYAAGTDSPQNAFKDTGLVLPHPNPIILASDGRVPQLYFADGSVHVRLTDSGGVVQFDEDFVLVVGPSSGGGGGGGSSVDPNAIFQTGMMDWQPISDARAGWVRCNGNTISKSGAGGSERNNADCQALFEYLYGKYPDAICPVSGSRTGNATNDFNNGKTIGLLDFREMTIGGLSTMGALAGDRGNFANIPHERGDQNTAASVVGEIVHQLTAVDTPTHSHGGSTGTNDVTHNHGGGTLFDHYSTGSAGTSGSATTVVTGVDSGGAGATDNESTSHSHLFTTGNFGGNQPHNVTSRTMLGTFYMRL
jgi:hypothetical protein